jgi:hypothetical protein
MINTTSQENNTTTKESPANSSKQPRAQHNLQNPIQTTINGQLLSKEKGRSTTSREVLQDVSKMNSVKVCRKDTN